MQAIDWANHSSYRFSGEINKIIKPLKKIGVNYFSYIKQFNNKSRIVLTNFPDWNKFYCDSKFYLRSSSFTNSIDVYEDYSQGFILGYNDNYLYKIAKEKFKLDRGVSLIYKNPNFCEFFQFGTIGNEVNDENLYFENLINLKQFIHYFREQSVNLCNDSDTIKFRDFDKNINYQKTIFNKIEKKSFVKIKKLYFYLSNDLKYFTKRETECIYNLIQGYPSKKSADIMGIAKRTYDMHLDNIKQKLECQKNSQIIYLLAKIGLLNSILNI